VLAVATEKRFPELPDVPTFKEQGFDLTEGAYRGLAVPPNTPKEIIDILYKACAKVNANPEFAKKMAEMGFVLEDFDPAASAKLIDKLTVDYKAILDELK
jgi:tripartite-type tricarboxylate transporter receptor subunit TctC